MSDPNGFTALHLACCNVFGTAYRSCDTEAAIAVALLLRAGANPGITDRNGRSSLIYVRQAKPHRRKPIALLVHAQDAEKASLLVKVRRLAIVATSMTVSSFSQGRVARDQLLPRVALAPLVAGQNDDEETGNFRAMLQVLLDMVTGPNGIVLPGDLFRFVLDFLMATWDPLRRAAGAGGQQPLQEQRQQLEDETDEDEEDEDEEEEGEEGEEEEEEEEEEEGEG